MRLVQFTLENGRRQVGLVEDDGHRLHVLKEVSRVYDLAMEAGRLKVKLETLIADRLSGQTVDYARVIAEKRLLPPLDHPDPAHCLVSGTGLTHLGSAAARDEMHHQAASADQSALTDSMRMFQIGLDGGKPPAGQIGAQPEWFYKGNGYGVVAPEQPLTWPAYALDGGEEAEVVGLYVIAESGVVMRVGFALGNEFSDHVMERQNYLYLAHSKLRTCSFGPELLVGELPADIRGQVSLRRENRELWRSPFLTGEANMSYAISALEHHHFKYDLFRRPGDVHCHFFGTATLSFAAGIEVRPGDIFEIAAAPFGQPLRNPVQASGDREVLVTVETL